MNKKMQSAEGSGPSTKPSRAARAEAAAWLARLHGPNRTPEVEAGFRQWLAEDPERAAAFELLTETWEKSARLRRRPFEEMASWQLPGFRISFSRAASAAAATALIAIVGTFFYLRADGVTTRIGEQRILALEDGTRVTLNTNSQVVQRYDAQARRIELRKGEAMFEVARNSNWPFIVTAGDRQIRALGTAFIVRRELAQVAVTLVEGRVVVSPVAEDSGANAQSQGSALRAQRFELNAGERITFVKSAVPKLDLPSMEKVTAWQRGQVALDDTALADAVAEMNRYSHTRLVIADL